MKTIAQCNSLFEAELIKGNLENSGLHPVVFNNTMNSIYPLVVSDTFYIEVRVPDEEETEALAYLMEDMRSEAIDAEKENESEQQI